MTAINNLSQSLLGLKLRPVNIKELVLHLVAPADIYRFENSNYTITFKAKKSIDKEILKSLLLQGHQFLYMNEEAYNEIQNQFREIFLKNARSLSIGAPEEKSKRQIQLLSLNLSNLYNNPLNDQILNLQFQGTQNLSIMLLENKNLSAKLYKDLKKLKQHFIIAQPLLSSLLTIAFLDYLKVYQNKELENFFLASMFKDIGMSFIPNEKYDKSDLTVDDKKVFKAHPEQSKIILDGRINLSRNYLEMIENHHFLSEKTALIKSGQFNPNIELNHEIITGLETHVLAIMDILVAMTEGRPYQEKYSLFETLELVKKLMEAEYPTEFRALVIFLNKFFA